MKLMVAPYNDDAGTWTEVEETAFLHYAPTHGFDNPAEVTITLSDPIGLLAQKYNATSVSAVGGAVSDNGGVETDETAEANENTANDMTLVPSPATVNDAYYIGFSKTFDSFRLYVSKIYTGGTLGITWEYSTGADSWTALSGVVDGTDDYETLGENAISWTVPSDWATDTVGGIADLYWVRGRVTTAIAIILHPLGQQAWIGGVYVGPGKVTIEDPDSTDIFYGRIMKATADTGARTLTLYCQDWLSQLDETQITYDMREKLGTTDLRQSTMRSDVDGGRIVAEDDAGTYYFYDDGDYDDDGGMAFANDQHNDDNLVLTDGMAGKKKWTFYPHDSTVTDEDAYTDTLENIWVDDNATDHGSADNDWTWEHEFECFIGHNTPSDFYVHDSITEVEIEIVYGLTTLGSGNHAHVGIYDNNAAGYEEIRHLDADDLWHRDIIKVPLDIIPYVVDANGILKVNFDVDRLGGTAALVLKYLAVHITTETTGYSTAIAINDTINPNKIEVAADLTAAATRVWEGLPYCFAKPIFKHIESATGPILGGDSMVTLTCGDANVEDTDGISTRQYVGKTRLQIAKDLARQDKAHLWIALGTTIVTYKSTFNDGSPETLTDTDVNSWASTLDYSTLTNEVTAYGMRIGDQRLSSTYTDATSEAKYNQTRTKITSDTGLVSEYDTLARATALVNQYKDVQQILSVTIRGNTAKASHDKTLVLGDEVSITSTYLGLSSAVYIVQRWSYDSNPNVNLTTLLLHPRVSQVGLQKDERPSFEMVMQNFRRGSADAFIAAPETNEVA